MPIKRKQPSCLNCGHPYTTAHPDEYCPKCGQENNQFKLSAWELFSEWIVSVLNLDSRMGHSIIPFLFQPGHLPKAFMEGRRAHYVHPVRFYIFVSFVFFFVFFQGLNKVAKNADEQEEKEKRTLFTKGEIEENFRQTNKFIKQAVLSGQISASDAYHISLGIDTLNVEKIHLYEQKDLNARYDKETGISLDSEGEILRVTQDNTDTTESYYYLFNRYRINSDKVKYVWVKEPGMTPERLLDSMHVARSERNWFDYRLAEQTLKMGQEKGLNTVQKEIFENIPVMMFFLMPVFAMLLKLLYVRSGRLYIEHLIFTLHLHSYLFFMLTVCIGSFFLLKKDYAETVIATGSLIIVVYLFMMFKRYYEQGWIKTFIKTSILFWSYMFLLVCSIMFEILVSLLTF